MLHLMRVLSADPLQSVLSDERLGAIFSVAQAILDRNTKISSLKVQDV